MMELLVLISFLRGQSLEERDLNKVLHLEFVLLIYKLAKNLMR